MDENQQRILERVLKLSEDTNRMLRQARRERMFGRFLKIIYWIIIIIIAVGIYNFIRPYLTTITNLSQTVQEIQSKVPGL